MTLAQTKGVYRHFVTVGRGQLHYRRAGDGPPLVLLHAAPFSSESLEHKLLDLSGRFTVMAVDLPGYGGSTAIADPQPRLADYAAALTAFLDAVGVAQACFYGEGEGGAVAMALAASAPARVKALAVNGVPDIAPGDRNAFVRELPDLTPRWDGAHLCAAWSWLNEHAVFAPFHMRTAARRIHEPPPSTHDLQRRLVQILSMPSQGRAAFAVTRAALDLDAEAALTAFAGPCLITGAFDAKAHDLAERLSGRNGVVAKSSQDAWRLIMRFFAAQAENLRLAPVPSAPPARAIPGAMASRYVEVGGGQMHAWFNDDADTLPLVVQHDAASSVGTVAPILEELIGRRRLIAFDLPGSGLSDAFLPEGTTVADYAGALASALSQSGLTEVDVYGMWGGGFVGLDMAFANPRLVRRLVMSNAFFHEGEELRAVQEHYTPSVAPVWHGGHLMQAWRQMRDQGLFYPWFDRSAQGILRREPFLATEMVHERVCSLLKAGDWYASAYHSHFVYPTLERLSRSPVPTLLASTSWDPNYPHVMDIVARTPGCDYLELEQDFTRWGVSFLPWLEADDAPSGGAGHLFQQP